MSAQRTQERGVGDLLRKNLWTGALFGAAAYVVSYIVTFVFMSLDGVSRMPSEVPFWKTVGWIFYGVHFVNSELSVNGQSQSIDIFQEASANSALTSTIPELVYYLAPIVILISAGYFTYLRATEVNLSTSNAAAVGGTVIVGYFVLGIIGKFVFSESRAVGTFAPELAMSVVLLGIIYPLIFGGIGGVVSSLGE